MNRHGIKKQIKELKGLEKHFRKLEKEDKGNFFYKIKWLQKMIRFYNMQLRITKITKR